MIMNIGGALIRGVVYLYSNANSKMCTHLGGACLYFANRVAMPSFYISNVQILVLSSNTKKGEIERAFPSLSEFWVFVDNTSDPNCVLSVSRVI